VQSNEGNDPINNGQSRKFCKKAFMARSCFERRRRVRRRPVASQLRPG
jgi:hypothetical protein